MIVLAQSYSHFFVSISDSEILQRSHKLLKKRSHKRGDENKLSNIDLCYNCFSKIWSILGKKEYQSVLEFLRVILHVKKPELCMLSIVKEAFSRKYSSDHIFVENYLCRRFSQWAPFLPCDGVAFENTKILCKQQPLQRILMYKKPAIKSRRWREICQKSCLSFHYCLLDRRIIQKHNSSLPRPLSCAFEP